MYEKSFDLVYNRLVEASDVIVVMVIIIIALGFTIYKLWGKISNAEKAHKKLVAAKDKEIARVNSSNIEIVKSNTGAMTKMLILFDEIRNDIKDFKNDN